MECKWIDPSDELPVVVGVGEHDYVNVLVSLKWKGKVYTESAAFGVDGRFKTLVYDYHQDYDDQSDVIGWMYFPEPKKI